MFTHPNLSTIQGAYVKKLCIISENMSILLLSFKLLVSLQPSKRQIHPVCVQIEGRAPEDWEGLTFSFSSGLSLCPFPYTWAYSLQISPSFVTLEVTLPNNSCSFPLRPVATSPLRSAIPSITALTRILRTLTNAKKKLVS